MNRGIPFIKSLYTEARKKSTKNELNLLNKMKNILLSIVAVLGLINIALGQEKEIQKKKVSVTFAHPVSSNGANTNVENTASLNIIYGINSGVNGAELSAVGGINKGDVKGGQFAGVFNATKGNVKGAQFAGVANITKNNVTGGQFSAVSNVTMGDQRGASFAGVNNFAKGNVTGGQFGVTNVALQKVNGIQAGVVNVVDTLSGVQFGIVNVSKNVERGTPIGLINIVKNGYYAIEVTSGDVNVAGISYKMGTTDFYTIFKYGYTPDYISKYTNHSVGLGFGTLRNLSKNGKHQLAIDLSASSFLPYQGSDKSDTNDRINMTGKLDINYHYKITKNISVLGGPSLNGYYSEVQAGDTGNFGTISIPSHGVSYQEFNETNTQAVWLGFNVGINYTF